MSDSGEHRRNTDGLIPWKPGQSGNPAGRPKGTTLTDRLRKILESDDGKVAEALMRVATKAALKGDFRFWQEILNRMDGKVLDRSEQLIRQIAIEFNEARKEGDDVS